MAAISEKITQAIEKRWYSHPGWLYSLYILELLFSYFAKKRKQKQTHQRENNITSAPIVVLGNLTVGGTGKTPTIIAITQYLQAQGKKVGVVSRGYGRNSEACLLVTESTTPDEAGDEPYLIYSRTQCAMAVCEDRVAAIRLLELQQCDVILSDDGLQHYRMPRDFEIVLIDGMRGFGNGHILPVGPLRENIARCESVDWVLVNGQAIHKSLDQLQRFSQLKVERIDMEASNITALTTGESKSLDFLTSLNNWIAVAGIGNPQRFFQTLEHLNLSFSKRIFADHHWFEEADFSDVAARPVIMTEKDAVKCKAFAQDNWYQLDVTMQINIAWLASLNLKLDQFIAANPVSNK